MAVNHALFIEGKIAQINKLHRTDLERFSPSSLLSSASTTAPRIPRRYSDFLRWIGITATSGQATIVARAFDPDDRKPVIVAVCGARGGKSYILGALRLLHGALSRDLSRMAAGQNAVALIVAPDLRLSREVINYVRGAISLRPELSAMVQSDSELRIVIERPDGQSVAIEALPATRGGGALRGRSLTDALLDECAFFRDEGYAVNDVELFKAVRPRVLPGGQTIVSSTPWGESGLLYDLWRGGSDATTDVFHAPTLMLRDDDAGLADVIAAERLRDPENARREFDARFMTSGSGQFFDSNAIRGAVADYDVEAVPYVKRYRYACGVDLGFKTDSSAMVVAQYDGEKYSVASIMELRPEEGSPLVPSEVIATFAAIAKRYGCQHVISDGHYREAVAEHLLRHQLALIDAPAGASGKTESYTRARAVLHEGSCIIPDHARLIGQLRAVVCKPTSGGGLSISSPRKPGGGHGDIVSAWVLAVHYLATARVEPEKERPPLYGSPEYEMWLAEKSCRAMEESDQKRYGRRGADDW